VREGPSTSAELASVAGFNERCAREWGTAGNGRHLETENPSASDAERRGVEDRVTFHCRDAACALR
jgi:hypothetical protein